MPYPFPFPAGADGTDSSLSRLRLLEERDRLARAVAASGHGIWDWDLETGEVFVSPRWTEMLGRDPHDPATAALHSPKYWLDTIHPDDRGTVADAFAAFVTGKSADYDVEFRMRYVDGTYRWIRSRGVAQRRSDGTAWRVTGTHSDMTERKQLEVTQSSLLRQQSRISETLQRVLLPQPNGVRFDGIEVATHYEPASDEALVGGDFCDAFPLGEHEVALVVGDVMGKGLGAAVATAEIKFTLRTLLRQYRDPAVALRLLNRLLFESYRNEQAQNPPLVPVAVAVANTRARYLRVSVAGAEPPMILRQDARTGALRVQEVEGGGMLIGALPEEEYERQIVSMGEGDCFLMTTDGLTEVRDAVSGTFLGSKGVARLAYHALAARRPLEDVTGTLLRSVRNYGGGANALRDDVSLLLARWKG